MCIRDRSTVGFALGAAAVVAARSTAWRVSRYGLWAGLGLAALFAAGWAAIPALFTSSLAVQHQAHILWPWFVAMLPVAGVVFALDGVLIGAGDVAFLRTITLVAAVCFFAPINLLALHLDWGIGGVWAGLAAFIAVRFVGMVLRVRGSRWVVTGASS